MRPLTASPVTMRVAVVFLILAALAACVAASGIDDEIVGSSLETAYSKQPVVVVRKTTYYEPELIAVVVEKGVDDIPEETYLIQNYADVLGTSNNEIRLCSTDNTNQCLDTPVTKLLVPSLFQSVGQTGFRKFFEQAKQVPWVSTIDDTVQLVNPVLKPKSNAAVEIVSPEVFRYIPPTSSISPSDIQAGFATLDQTTTSTGGPFLGGATTKTTYQHTPAYFDNPYRRRRRALGLFPYLGY